MTYKVTINMSMDHEDLDPEEFYKLVCMKLDRLKENIKDFDQFIGGGGINDEIGFCNYNFFYFDNDNDNDNEEPKNVFPFTVMDKNDDHIQ